MLAAVYHKGEHGEYCHTVIPSYTFDCRRVVVIRYTLK